MATTPNLGSRAFVLGMLGADGTIVAGDVYAVGERLGFTTHQIRLVFARLVEEGAFVQEGRGRRAVLRATPRFDALHVPEIEWLRLAYRQDAGQAPWDGRWCLVTFSIDESRRAARNSLRELLTALTAAPLAGGVYVHAVDIGPEVTAAADALGVRDHLSVARADSLDVGGRHRPSDLAAHLWPLDDLAAGYRTFVDRYRPVASRRRATDPVDELAAAVELVSAFRSCIEGDPLLPPELLPARWPGTAARRVLRQASARLVRARAAAGVPALFSRFDEVFAELDPDGGLRAR